MRHNVTSLRFHIPSEDTLRRLLILTDRYERVAGLTVQSSPVTTRPPYLISRAAVVEDNTIVVVKHCEGLLFTVSVCFGNEYNMPRPSQANTTIALRFATSPTSIPIRHNLSYYHRVMPLRWLRKARLLKLRTTTKATVTDDTNEDGRAHHVSNELVSESLPTTASVLTRAARPLTNASHGTAHDALTVVRADGPTVTSSPTIAEDVVPEYTHPNGASGDPRSSHNDPSEDAPPTSLVAMTVPSAFTIWLRRALRSSFRVKKRRVSTTDDAKEITLGQATDRPNAIVIAPPPTPAAQLSSDAISIVDSPHAPVTDDEPVRQATAPPTSTAPTSPPSATQAAGDTSSLPSIPDTRFPGVPSNNEGSERTSPSRKKPPTIHISTATNDISLSTFSLLRRSRPGVEAAPRGWPSHMPTELVGLSPADLDLPVTARTQDTAPMLWLEESALCESPSSMSPAEPESSAEESVPYLDLGQREVQSGGDQAHLPAYDASAGIDHPDPSPQHVASPHLAEGHPSTPSGWSA
ncbi:hypothetical protein NM688_g8505 [Phlebia brevispora]|uniref:Uncharacterized protein n=1 Tax=Phlebia brevispora TaxID=194682 RepID=A0ACC1RQQ1_9APHY|nr:hypothetical protein NM688_g8505 [Phlebia brevispora]